VRAFEMNLYDGSLPEKDPMAIKTEVTEKYL